MEPVCLVTFPIVPDQHLADTENPVVVPGPGHPPDHHLVLTALHLAEQPHVGARRHHVLHHTQHTPVPGQQGNYNKTETCRTGTIGRDVGEWSVVDSA